MSNYRRSNIAGGTYFFTLNSFRRQPILTLAPLRHALRLAIQNIRLSHPFEIDAWVLLPDHLHCIWTLPEGDSGFSMRWSLIKRMVTQTCANDFSVADLSPSRIQRKESAIWQRRFWEHQIRDDEDFERHVDYIHWNPVKHGLVQHALDWPYSTFHRYVETGKLTPNWGVGMETDGNFGE
ncbi:REP-associated tyrosine transposase [Undibacterium parvum]|uniref:Transposase n=1 Tax=Undibacterium parvum TaxID=401471 RepID=A0A3Q9BS27_9BURK|nr:transposase [Undibacterium parvum]AZP13229.1 transposase [Undibacterium parvum]